MGRNRYRCGWVVGAVLLISAVCLPATDALAVARQRHNPLPVPSQPAPVVAIIDGTPRPAPASDTRIVTTPPTGPARRWTPPAPGDPTPLSLQTINDQPGMASALGGDDVQVASFPGTSSLTFLQVADDGELFAAMTTNPSNNAMDIYRSTDGGDTWTLWSTFSPGSLRLITNFMIAQGDADRAFIAYRDWSTSPAVGLVARAELSAAPPVWTVVTCIAIPGADVNPTMSFDTDAWGFSDYYIYVIGVADDGNGQDVWFTRSLNLGVSFEAEVKIADVSDGSFGYLNARVMSGFGGYVHTALTLSGTTSAGVIYRRAANYAGAAWDLPITITPTNGSISSTSTPPFASRTDGNVLLLLNEGPGGTCRYSTDSGATWPPANYVNTGHSWSYGRPVARPGSGLVIGGFTQGPGMGDPGFERMLLARSATGSPAGLAAPMEMSLFASQYWHTGASLVADPTRGNQIAALFISDDGTNVSVRFDAEWRRDPGYPNTDIGFPIALAGGGQTPPAVAELDGDPEKEIVFVTLSGDIHVINHDGTPVSGWPVNIGFVPFDAAVAVGDLVGNGVPAIVAGNSAGQVFAFDPGGTLLPGWPVTMNEADDVFVSIGALGPPFTRYVVAVCGHEMRAIPYTGELLLPKWIFSDVVRFPAAIGDIDNDGVTEIVTLKNDFYNANVLGAASPKYFKQFFGEVFHDAPTLADMDANGTLEIAAPTNDGDMYLLNYDGSNYSVSWPITVSPGIGLTSATFGQILGTSQPELVFGELTGAIHVRYFDGVEQTGYPRASGSTGVFTPPMLSPVNITGSNVNIGTTDTFSGTGQSWRNIPASGVPGWPRNLPGPVEETFASGDIDNDGRNELVVVGVDFVTVLDVGIAPATNPRNHWPMYGYDAQRTGCLDCVEILTAVGDTPGAGYNTRLAVHPNPFNPTTTIEYEVARAGPVSLEVFDVGGHRVATLIANEHREAGRYSIAYQAAGASGVYFARLRTADGEISRKLVVLK